MTRGTRLGQGVTEGAPINGRHSRIRITFAVVLVVLSALALFKNYEWGSAYSAIVGLPSRVRDAEIYVQRARLFGWCGAALDLIAAAIIFPLVYPQARGSSRVGLAIGRFAAALGIVLLGTGVIFGIFVLVVVRFRLS